MLPVIQPEIALKNDLDVINEDLIENILKNNNDPIVTKAIEYIKLNKGMKKSRIMPKSFQDSINEIRSDISVYKADIIRKIEFTENRSNERRKFLNEIDKHDFVKIKKRKN